MKRVHAEHAGRTQALILGTLCLALAGADWQLLLAPARAGLIARQARLAELSAGVVRARATAATLPAAEQDVQALERALRETTAILSAEQDPQKVLRHLYEVARDSSLDLSRFTPKAMVNREHYWEWPVELELDGDYHDLGRFFDRLASVPQLLSVSDLQIRAHAEPVSGRTIVASCTVTTFVFQNEVAFEAPAELPAAARMGVGQ